MPSQQYLALAQRLDARDQAAPAAMLALAKATPSSLTLVSSARLITW